MFDNRTSFKLIFVAALAAWGASSAGGCAGVPDEDLVAFGGGSSSSTGSPGAGGQGGSSTGSGTGGSGGTSGCAIDCTQIKAPPCQVAQCNAQTGQCEVVPNADGTACDDGVFCTIDDACLAGVCEGGPPNDCGLQPGDCDDVTCNETAQTCSTSPKANGSFCTDSNDLCQVNTTCQNGLCIGDPKDCFFSPVPDDCHVSQCNPQNGQCEPVPGNEGQACVDQTDLCTVNKTCAAGVCQGGSPKDCSQLTQGCVMGVCDVNTGQCTTQQVGQGQPCDDLDFCTTGETCDNGQCTGGSPVTTCVDGDGCCPSNCNETNDQECAIPSGVAYLTTSGTVPVQYLPCGSGAPGQCTGQTAQTSCQQVGRKVVAHASDGTSTVASLGATSSCYWSVSYYTVGTQMPPGSCLVGVSNLMWSSCCNLSSWHGNTMDFGAPNQIFGYVSSNDSGYNANNPNVSGTKWGCTSVSSAATNKPGCTTQYVACTP